MIHAIGDAEPVVAPDAFVAWNAEVAGDAVIGEGSSVWFGVTVRADIAEVRIGAGTVRSCTLTSTSPASSATTSRWGTARYCTAASSATIAS
jgi:carbonic anhydrase/acetyltransferase-like protein (isoleucine patch superfamily)